MKLLKSKILFDILMMIILSVGTNCHTVTSTFTFIINISTFTQVNISTTVKYKYKYQGGANGGSETHVSSFSVNVS